MPCLHQTVTFAAVSLPDCTCRCRVSTGLYLSLPCLHQIVPVCRVSTKLYLSLPCLHKLTFAAMSPPDCTCRCRVSTTLYPSLLCLQRTVSVAVLSPLDFICHMPCLHQIVSVAAVSPLDCICKRRVSITCLCHILIRLYLSLPCLHQTICRCRV